ncbi:hypothetical protein B0H17DRAFT_1133216 [Mycena rosella]|uniref:Uncharacterized protein n=1 Tax=Mycena rosella TaxID=1033263 RepID=A0AAD7GIA7_MYCRO|nr:hypothetical protein B0H17DRAFT_1133216 [Mycena rosella]
MVHFRSQPAASTCALCRESGLQNEPPKSWIDLELVEKQVCLIFGKWSTTPGGQLPSPGQYGGNAIQLSEKKNSARQGLTDILRAGFQLLKCNFVNMPVQGYEQRPFQDGVLAFRIMGQILSYDQADSAVTFLFCDIDVGKATCEIERILPGPWLAVSGGAEGGKFLVIGLLLVSLLIFQRLARETITPRSFEKFHQSLADTWQARQRGMENDYMNSLEAYDVAEACHGWDRGERTCHEATTYRSGYFLDGIIDRKEVTMRPNCRFGFPRLGSPERQFHAPIYAGGGFRTSSAKRGRIRSCTGLMREAQSAKSFLPDEMKGIKDQSIGILAIAFAILISTIIQTTTAVEALQITRRHPRFELDEQYQHLDLVSAICPPSQHGRQTKTSPNIAVRSGNDWMAVSEVSAGVCVGKSTRSRWMESQKAHTTFLVVGLALLILINIIFLIDIELTLSRNKHLQSGEDDLWGFGQTSSQHRAGPEAILPALREEVEATPFVERLRDLISEGAESKECIKDPRFANLFQLAAYHRKEDIVDFFLTEGVAETEPRLQGAGGIHKYRGERVLWVSTCAACANNKVEVATLLIAGGAKAELDGGKFGFPLHVASLTGENAEIIMLLLENLGDRDHNSESCEGSGKGVAASPESIDQPQSLIVSESIDGENRSYGITCIGGEEAAGTEVAQTIMIWPPKPK